MDNVRITINGQEYFTKKKTTLGEIATSFQKDFKYPIIAAKVNNSVKELNYDILKPKEIEFLDLTSRDGNRIHINSLLFVLCVAIKEIYGVKYDIRVQHSIDKGLYIGTNFVLTEERLNDIKNKMLEIIKEERPIEKLNVDRLEARDYFSKIGDKSKVNILKYTTNTYITLYKLGHFYDYFYGKMTTNTKYLKDFNLTYISKDGFILEFPTVNINDQSREYQANPDIFNAFHDCRAWAETIGITNTSELNDIVSTGNIDEYIRMAEAKQNDELLNIAKRIKESKDIKAVLIAGPSSSGKTTTSKKICMYLRTFGMKPLVVSMDDYFLERDETPLDENGKPNYETIDAIDLKLLDETIKKLINGEEIKVPTYNFVTGKKEYQKTAKFDKDGVLVIEGIHALEKKILANVEKKYLFKIYISALTEFNIDNHNYISTSTNRLLRRIVRDNKTRGHNVQKTISSWPEVRIGEEKYIFPYQDQADYIFNSGLIYEVGVLKTYVEPLLYAVDPRDSCYEEAKRLINFLGFFLPIPADAIPQDSILREFIGGSSFK